MTEAESECSPLKGKNSLGKRQEQGRSEKQLGGPQGVVQDGDTSNKKYMMLNICSLHACALCSRVH